MKKKKLALRLAQILVVLVGISFVTFLLTYLSPGDPVRNMYTAAGIMPTEELVAETREELGLNDPLPTQYLHWLRNCLPADSSAASGDTGCGTVCGETSENPIR